MRGVTAVQTFLGTLGALAATATSPVAAAPSSQGFVDPAPAAVGWQVEGTGPEMRLSLDAAQEVPLTLGDAVLPSPARPQLVVMCDKGKPRLAVRAGKLDRPEATVRLDREPPFETELHHQTKGGFILDAKIVNPDLVHFRDPRDRISDLLSHRGMLVEVIPRGQPARQLTFDLAGLDAPLSDFERACGVEAPIERPAVEAASAGDAPEAAPGPRTYEVEGWTVLRSTSKLDDRPIVVLAAQPGPGAPPPSNPATLVMRCTGGESEAYLKFRHPIFGRGFVVQASVDGGKSKDWKLAPSTDRKSQFFQSGPKLLKRLLASKELRLVYGRKKPRKNDKWMPKGELLFTLEGLYEASLPLVEACEIDLDRVKVKDGLGKLD